MSKPRHCPQCGPNPRTDPEGYCLDCGYPVYDPCDEWIDEMETDQESAQP